MDIHEEIENIHICYSDISNFEWNDLFAIRFEDDEKIIALEFVYQNLDQLKPVINQVWEVLLNKE